MQTRRHRIYREAGAAAPVSVLDVVTVSEARRLDRTVMELRDAGLSMPAIVTVLDFYEGVVVNEGQVREWLARMGAPRNPNRAAAARAAWAAA